MCYKTHSPESASFVKLYFLWGLNEIILKSYFKTLKALLDSNCRL